MSTKTILSMTVLASITFASCNKGNEMEVDRMKDTPMVFLTSVNGLATRAGYETGSLADDAIFGLTIQTEIITDDARYTQVNKQMKNVDGTWIEENESTKLLWKDSQWPVKYRAYVPYSAEAVTDEGILKTDYAVTVPENQTTEGDIKTADFLYVNGITKGSESPAGISLAFNHMLSQFKITLTKGLEIPADVIFTKISLTDCCALTTTIDLTNGTITTAAKKQNSSVNMLANTGNMAFECILVPQTFLKTLKVTITGSNNKTYIYNSNEDLTFASGKSYTLPLIVGRDRVEAGTITATPWIEVLPPLEAETE